jgi:hypothetical protein
MFVLKKKKKNVCIVFILVYICLENKSGIKTTPNSLSEWNSVRACVRVCVYVCVSARANARVCVCVCVCARVCVRVYTVYMFQILKTHKPHATHFACTLKKKTLLDIFFFLWKQNLKGVKSRRICMANPLHLLSLRDSVSGLRPLCHHGGAAKQDGCRCQGGIMMATHTRSSQHSLDDSEITWREDRQAKVGGQTDRQKTLRSLDNKEITWREDRQAKVDGRTDSQPDRQIKVRSLNESKTTWRADKQTDSWNKQSHTHTHTHENAHARTHTHTRARIYTQWHVKYASRMGEKTTKKGVKY